MWDLGALRDRGDFARRLAVTAVALIVYRLGAHIPLPGLDPHALSLLYGSDGRAIERISIVALGVYPFVSALILAELAKILVPALRRWEYASVRNRDSLNRWIVLLAIGVALVQATGYARALEGVTKLVVEPGVSFRIACAGSIVAGVALVIWLADQITRHGLGSGVWLLFVVPKLASLRNDVAALASSLGEGQISGTQAFVSLALVVVAIVPIAVVMMTARDKVQTAATCLWPVLLTYLALPWLLVIGSMLITGNDPNAMNWLITTHPVHILALAATVVLFVHLYVRSERSAGPISPSPLPPAVIAVALVASLFASAVLPAVLGLPPILPGGQSLVVIAVVAMIILARWWEPPGGMAAQRKASDEAGQL
jgi:preprotein translocase subunit SecY